MIKIRGLLRRGQFDVLNTHSRRDTIVAGCAGRLAGTPLIVRTRHLANKVGSLLSYTVIPHRDTTASEFVRRGLMEDGYVLDAAVTASEGLLCARIGSYDAIILDIGLPEKNGLEVCRELRRRNVMTPILMLSARDHVMDRVQGLKIGADDYLTKPFDRDELRARLRVGRRIVGLQTSETVVFAFMALFVINVVVTAIGIRMTTG